MCGANIAPNKNFSGLCLQDSPLAIRGVDFTTVFPAGIHVASTCNRALMRARGLSLGQEFKIQSSVIDQGDLIIAWENGEASPITEGSSVALWLHEPAFQVTFKVTNTGYVSGTEIPQLYIHHPSSACGPPSVLKGFTKVEIGPYDTNHVSIMLSRYDLDVVAQGWRKPDGQISFSVGASSRDFSLWGVIPA